MGNSIEWQSFFEMGMEKAKSLTKAEIETQISESKGVANIEVRAFAQGLREASCI